MSKRLALGLFGIHYLENYNHIWTGYNVKIDFRKSLDNYKEYIFEYFKDYKIDTFVSTYHSEFEDELFSNYQINDHRKLSIKTFTNNFPIVEKNGRFEKLLDLIINYQMSHYLSYDLCLITRFDLFFKLSFDKLNILENKLNYTCNIKYGDNLFIDDNFYIISKNDIYNLKKLSNHIPENKWYHEINNYNKGIFEINPMIEENYFSHENPLYNFTRLKV